MMKQTTILFALLSFKTFAVETDQFYAAKTVLKDSTEIVNNYFEDKFERALNKSDKYDASIKSCRKLADDVMSEIVGKFSISKVSAFAHRNPEIDRFPDDSISDGDQFRSSIYKNARLPFKVAHVSRTININGVYIGTDKLGHFALIGRNYYRRYLENLKKMNRAEAEKAAILTGISQEIHFLGYTLGGVLSFGDLEANYQGLQFSISMCEGENPFLKYENGKWQRNSKRSFSIAHFINPKMDESFNHSFWRPSLWNNIKNTVKEAYCDLKTNPLYIERVSFYKQQLTANPNDLLIKEFFKNKPEFARENESVEALCQ